MIRLIALVIVLWLPGNVASAKIEDSKRYGDCLVYTWLDDFTDEKEAVVTCPEYDSVTFAKGVDLQCKMGGRFVWLGAGLQFHPEETIPVIYRFDRGAARSGNWRFTENAAFSDTDSTFNEFVDGLRTAETLVFEVGDSSTVRISLKGSTEAMKDFDKRCQALRLDPK